MGAKVIGMYEGGWMDSRTDRRMWDNLCRAYGAELQMVNDWSEAIVPVGFTVVVCDEEGKTDLADFTHPEDAVYAFGKSREGLGYLMQSQGVSLRITTPNSVSMFGVSAAAIILEDRKP